MLGRGTRKSVFFWLEGNVIDCAMDLRRLFVTESPFYRGAFFLTLGALTMVLGALLSAAHRLEWWETGLLHGYLPYSLWTGSLVLLAIGFLWIGNAPDFSRVALLVSLLHLAQALNILIIVATNGHSPVPQDSLTMGRLASLLIFILADRAWVARGTRVILASVALLQIAKVNLRALEVLPSEETTGMLALDTALIVWMAGGFFLLAQSLLAGEHRWELAKNPEEAIGLADFNNPEHPWNKAEQKKEPV